MSTRVLERFGAWAALAAGVIQLLGLVFLVLFFGVELPGGSASALHFGFLSDVLPVVAAPLFLAVVVNAFLLQRSAAPALAAITVVLGVAAALLIAWTNVMFVAERITLEQQVQLFFISLALLGPWHILINALARRAAFLPSRLTGLGLLVGVGQLAMFLGSVAFRGYPEMMSLPLEAITADIRLLAALLIGVPLALIGYLGAPIWLVLFGLALLRQHRAAPVPARG